MRPEPVVPRDLPVSGVPAARPRGVVGWYAHHAGAGHVTRALAVAGRTRHDVVVLSSARRPHGWPERHWVALPDDAAPVGDDPTAGGALHWAPADHPGFTARMRLLADWVVRVRPVALVVDVSVEVALLGRLLGVPVVATVMAGDRSDRAHRLGYDAATALVAAWPASVGPAPVHGWRPEWTPRTRFTGALSRLDDVLPAPTADHPTADRPTADRPTGSDRVALRLGGAGAGGWWAATPPPTPGWRWTRPAASDPQAVADALAAADVVVLHAGQNALAEVAAARRPAVVVPDDRPHGEQLALAGAVTSLGAALVVDDPWAGGPDGWAAALDRAHRRGGDGWAAWSDGRGAERYAAVVDAVAGGSTDLDELREQAS